MTEEKVLCPNCKFDCTQEYEEEVEYTGGGFADTKYKYYCPECGEEFYGETKHGYI